MISEIVKKIHSHYDVYGRIPMDNISALIFIILIFLLAVCIYKLLNFTVNTLTLTLVNYPKHKTTKLQNIQENLNEIKITLTKSRFIRKTKYEFFYV